LTEPLDEGLVFARHDRVEGKVLIIGAGTVGSSLAMQLALLGVDLRLVDKDILEPQNIVRHQAGAPYLGQPKVVIADLIRQRLPHVNVEGIFGSFAGQPDPDDPVEPMPDEDQRRYIAEADVVIAATDRIEVQRHINSLCFELETTAVFPGVWVGPQTGEAESGEVLWVDPRRRMPCYECVTLFRQEAQDAEAGRGAQADIDSIVLATALVVRGLLQPESDHAQILRPVRGVHENLILVHGFMPPTREVGQIFNGRAIQNVRVRFPINPCPVCGRSSRPNTQRPPTRPPAPAVRVTSATAISMPRAVNPPPPRRSQPLSLLPLAGLLAALAALALLSWGVLAGVGAVVSWVHSLTGSAHAAAAGNAPAYRPPAGAALPAAPSASPSPSSPPQSVPWTSPASFPVTYPADMTIACVQQYGQGTSAQLTSTSVPSYDVVCVQGGSSVGGLDLDGFCAWLAQQDHYQSADGWWSGNPERFDTNTSDQPWLDWRCYDNENRP
jgi:molybdopterin/thiamine biosynthesis adenylyltransferase